MIGIFDSGSGGLSVLRALRAIAPEADIVYFGDLKNAPYGNKSREELGALSVLGIQKLVAEGATEIISACNSVSVSIVLPMFEILGIPRANIIEMVGPTVSSFRGKEVRVLVAATKATIDSRVYQDGFRFIGTEAEGVAIPTLVSLIESGAKGAEIKAEIRAALLPFKETHFDTLLLGCTHFPLVRSAFENVLRELSMPLAIFDPAEPVAKAACERFDTSGKGTVRFLLSKESGQFWEILNDTCPKIYGAHKSKN